MNELVNGVGGFIVVGFEEREREMWRYYPKRRGGLVS